LYYKRRSVYQDRLEAGQAQETPLLQQNCGRQKSPRQLPLSDKKARFVCSVVSVIVPKGTAVPQEYVDEFDFSGREDPSCMIWRELLLDVTTPAYALLWQWAPGDLLVWVRAVPAY